MTRKWVPAALAAILLAGIGSERLNSENPAELDRGLPEIVRDIQVQPLQIKPPRAETVRLPSGALLLRAADPSLPFITIEFFFEGGSNAEPVDRAGTLEAMTGLMEIGGAGERDGDAIAEALARLGARLKVTGEYEGWSVRLTVLKQDFAAGFDLLDDVLLRPRFPADRLEVVQGALLTGIQQHNDQPESIARRKLMETLYGDLRAGYTLQAADVKKINVDLLKEEHKRRLNTGGLLIALSGDFQGLAVEERINTLLKDLPARGSLTIETVKRTGNPYSKKILLVKTPATQAAILAGTYLPAHNHGDFYGLQTGNYILGGGSFNSRLMREIRTRRGLAYYAYSYNTFRADGGTFFAGSGTRTAATAETVGLIKKIVGDMPAKIEEKELDLAREAILNSMVFQYADPEKFLENEIRFRRHGMPEQYLAVFAEKVRAIKTSEIRAVFARNVKPDALTVVVVGPESLRAELQKILPVLVIGPEETGFRDRLK